MASPYILLVEDDPDDELLTLDALRTGGLQISIVVKRDGAEALDYLFANENGTRRESGLPQLVILDLKLPKISGHEVLRRIRSDKGTRHLPVVVLTSSNEEEDIEKAYGNGVNSYVRKPVDFDEFAKAVQSVGAYWTIFNQPPPSSGVK